MSQITASNYAAQCEQYCREFADLLKPIKGAEIDYGAALLMAELIKKSQHFALPDGGLILDDGYKGIIGEELRLPHNPMTIEYFVKDGGEIAINGNVSSSKRLAVAFDMDEDRIVVITAFFADKENTWCITPLSAVLPRICVTQDLPRRIESDGSVSQSYVAQAIPMFPFILNESGSKHDDPGLIKDTMAEVSALLELLEALSCRNVSTEVVNKIDAAKQAKRIKQGKLPFYETHILVVDGKSSGSHSSNGQTGITVRQHLRRGHIRKHPTAGNIWVNACVVGSAENGKIEKQYHVTH